MVMFRMTQTVWKIIGKKCGINYTDSEFGSWKDNIYEIMAFRLPVTTLRQVISFTENR